MKNRYISSFICILLSVCLAGCVYSGELEQEKRKEQNKEAEIINKKLPLKEPERLHFVDVFGNPYEVEINPNIAKKKYQDTKFIRDGDKLIYEDDDYFSRLGVDVSYHQGSIDWEKVKADGYDFAMIRIGYRGYGKEGSLNLDTRFHDNIKNAQNAGFDVGVYFFAQAINEEEALEEAEFVLEYLNGYQLQLPVVYDPESMNILVREYRCSGGTDTANPAAGNRCSGTGIPHLMIVACEFTRLRLDLIHIPPAWICSSPDPSGRC